MARKTNNPNSPVERALVRAKLLGMNQTEFADALDLSSPQVFNNWRRRGMPPAYHHKAAMLLDWSVEELLGTEAKQPQSEWPFQKIPPARITRLTEGQKMQLEGVMLDKLHDIETPSLPVPRRPRRRASR